jgi:hypothetical protein
MEIPKADRRHLLLLVCWMWCNTSRLDITTTTCSILLLKQKNFSDRPSFVTLAYLSAPACSSFPEKDSCDSSMTEMCCGLWIHFSSHQWRTVQLLSFGPLVKFGNFSLMYSEGWRNFNGVETIASMPQFSYGGMFLSCEENGCCVVWICLEKKR